MSMDYMDWLYGESNCCGAKMYIESDICSECGEHCVNHEDEEED